MQQSISLSYLWSKPFLTSKMVLWLLFAVNFAGTVYGYMWYWNQLEFTADTMPLWYVLLVPDSPTASLFFTLSLLYLIIDHSVPGLSGKRASFIRGFVEAFALITSFKYGIWAVVMIFAAGAQGDTIVWQDWMLTVSHLGMAAEALLFSRFYTYNNGAIIAVSMWTLWNDYMDYGIGIFPWLPQELDDDLGTIWKFTVSLSIISILIAWSLKALRKKAG